MPYDFSQAECKKWVKDGMPAVNPQTKRSINPEAEFGVYKELERQCRERNVLKKKPQAQNNAPPPPSSSCSNAGQRFNSSHGKYVPVGRMIIIRQHVNPLLENVMRCMNKHCESQGDKAREDIMQLKDMLSSGFDSAKTLNHVDEYIEKLRRLIQKKELKNLVRCGFESCKNDLDPFIIQYKSVFGVVKEEALKILVLKVFQESKLAEQVLKRIDQMSRDIEVMHSDTNGTKFDIRALLMPLVYIQATKAIIAIMYETLYGGL